MGGKASGLGVAVFLALTLVILGVMAFYSASGRVVPLLVVKTGSMEPTLMVGDVIIIEENISPEEIRVGPDGDVIIFRNPWTGELIVHRAVGKMEGGFITKGDANAGVDIWSPVPSENIIGRWTGFKIPYWTGVGYASLFLRGEIYPPYGKIVFVALIFLNAALLLRDFLRRRVERESSEPQSSEPP